MREQGGMRYLARNNAALKNSVSCRHEPCCWFLSRSVLAQLRKTSRARRRETSATPMKASEVHKELITMTRTTKAAIEASTEAKTSTLTKQRRPGARKASIAVLAAVMTFGMAGA